MVAEVDPSRESAPGPPRSVDPRLRVLRRTTRMEMAVAGIVAVILLGLTIAEPKVLEAPFENARTLVFTFGGAALAMAAYLVMLRLRWPPLVRILVVGVPFVAVTYWLVEPYFVDDKVDDEFVTSIKDALGPADVAPTDEAPAPLEGSDAEASTPTLAATDPVLLGAGTFRGLAGHDGSGAAGFFALPDGARVLRLESFDIQNGPDLRLYVVPGADQTDPTDGSLYLGELRGNVGDQTYDLPPDFDLSAGSWTVLVWCEAFSVEFVAATVAVR